MLLSSHSLFFMPSPLEQIQQTLAKTSTFRKNLLELCRNPLSGQGLTHDLCNLTADALGCNDRTV